MYSKILVPIAMTDTDSAARALDVASSVAKAFGGDVTVMTFQERDQDDARMVPNTAAARFRAFVEEQSKRLGRPLAGAFRIGDNLGAEISATVKEIDADLVVMRSHDPTWLDHLTGSRSSSVALHAPCSVLVVR